MRLPSLRGTQQILNGASVISSPFIGVELTSWKARTQPQVTAVFDRSWLRALFAAQRLQKKDPERVAPSGETSPLDSTPLFG